MNKRHVQELAWQCTEHVEGTLDGDITVFHHEEFAKLIIQECIDLFEIEFGTSELTGNDAAYFIKKHFGVEK